MIFKIGSKDFTKCVVMDSYTVNKVDAYSEYKDANGVTHRYSIRSKVVGSLSLYFRNNDYYNDFVDCIKNQKLAEGYFILTLTTNNTNETLTVNAYLDATPARSTVGARDTLKTFSISLEER